VSFFTVQSDTLSELSPSEQAVYVRLSLISQNGKARGRYKDIAKSANVSLSTFKRAIKSLCVRGLVEVAWRQKTASLFILKEKTRARAETAGTKWYDQLEPEDREMFLFIKRGIPPLGMKELLTEALEFEEDIDKLIFKKNFGIERQRKYEHLL
jgi:DNA-binding MarR family transcriptional regulator